MQTNKILREKLALDVAKLGNLLEITEFRREKINEQLKNAIIYNYNLNI